jgi:hypothetical protein
MKGGVFDNLDGATAVNEKAHSALAEDTSLDQKRDCKIAWSARWLNERKKQMSWAQMVDGLAGLLPDIIRRGGWRSYLADCGTQNGDGLG